MPIGCIERLVRSVPLSTGPKAADRLVRYAILKHVFSSVLPCDQRRHGIRRFPPLVIKYHQAIQSGKKVMLIMKEADA